MKDKIVISNEMKNGPSEGYFAPNPVIELHVPPRPILKNIKDDDLEFISFSAKRVADNYYELLTLNYNWFRVDVVLESKFDIYLALAGLTCEIYLKAILYKLKGIKESERRKHNLKELFELLEKCRHDLAQKIVSNVCEGDYTKFCEELDRTKDVFNEFRYSYELNGYTISIVFVSVFLKSLKEIADELFQ